MKPDDSGPTLRELLSALDRAGLGQQMFALAERLYPICRSLTGPGVRETLGVLGETIPLAVQEIPTGTPIFDWTVPKEWRVRAAWILDPQGKTIVDFRHHNLHLVSYSVPVAARLPLAELQDHLHSLPERPEWIPYRTSYWRESWGFCLPHRQRESLRDGEYEVLIDSELVDGQLTYGELLLPGECEQEILLSCHVCHPSLANDNLSGIAVCTALARILAGARRRYSYRFLFLPGTIGAIAWLALNQKGAARIQHGLVAANLGDTGTFHYKRSRRGHAEIDRAAAVALRDCGGAHALLDFVPYGYDERQYCSPGFNLAVGSLTRTPWGRYPEYHTSADNLTFIHPAALGDSLALYLEVLATLEGNHRYRNLNPHCEPQLGRRGLYGSLGGVTSGRERELALLWVLNLSDGANALLDIAERSGLPFAALEEAAQALVKAGLLHQLNGEAAPER